MMIVPRIYADDSGNSILGDIDIPLADGGPIGLLSSKFNAGDIIFRETPADYDFKWHPAPARQLLFIIKGQAEFTVSNGDTLVLGAGAVLMLEDTWGQGHCSKALNNEVRHSVFVTMPNGISIT
jgi:hypothetical protein